MNRQLWGEFEDGSDQMPEVQLSEMVLPQDKRENFAAFQSVCSLGDEQPDTIIT